MGPKHVGTFPRNSFVFKLSNNSYFWVVVFVLVTRSSPPRLAVVYIVYQVSISFSSRRLRRWQMSNRCTTNWLSFAGYVELLETNN